MRTCNAAALTLLGLALLWSASVGGTPSIGAADGWYKWQVDGGDTTLFVYQQKGKPARVRMFNTDCRLSAGGPKGEVTDMGELSLDDSVAMLLDIAGKEDLDMHVREEALFGLAQSDSDTAFAYLNRILFEDQPDRPGDMH